MVALVPREVEDAVRESLGKIENVQRFVNQVVNYHLIIKLE